MSGRELISKSFNLGSSYVGVMTMHAPVVIACFCSCSIQRSNLPNRADAISLGLKRECEPNASFSYLNFIFQRSLLKLFLILPTPETVV
jgi:hypothetical protein